jgi:hypothetical protein
MAAVPWGYNKIEVFLSPIINPIHAVPSKFSHMSLVFKNTLKWFFLAAVKINSGHRQLGNSRENKPIHEVKLSHMKYTSILTNWLLSVQHFSVVLGSTRQILPHERSNYLSFIWDRNLY